MFDKIKKIFTGSKEDHEDFTIHYDKGELIQILDGKIEHKPAYYIETPNTKSQVFSHGEYVVSEVDEIPPGLNTFKGGHDVDTRNLFKMLKDNDRRIRKLGITIIRNKENT